MKLFVRYSICLLLISCTTFGQSVEVSNKQFFADESPLDVKLVVNMGKLLSGKMDAGRHSATMTMQLPDGTQLSEKVTISVNGNFRRRTCYIPPMKIHFNKNNSKQLQVLNTVKLTSCCKPNEIYDQYLLKEYLIYKMYNLLTDRSFNVRLLNMTYEDSLGKKKPVTQHGFFVEDVKNLAKRVEGREWKKPNLHTEATERRQMTIVALFEYMIGNTDWAVPVLHNIKLIQPRADSMARPYAVPYDFDFSGLVNTSYATPDPQLNTATVAERVYRGFPRNPEEVNEILTLFQEKKEAMYQLIKNFTLLSNSSRKDMTQYLDEFYRTLKNPNDVRFIFIENARKE